KEVVWNPIMGVPPEVTTAPAVVTTLSSIPTTTVTTPKSGDMREETRCFMASMARFADIEGAYLCGFEYPSTNLLMHYRQTSDDIKRVLMKYSTKLGVLFDPLGLRDIDGFAAYLSGCGLLTDIDALES